MANAYFTAARAIPEPHLPPGWRQMAFKSIDSTNSALKRLVEQGGDVAEGLLLWAESQTAGRGRSGRTWASPPGNVYASILIAAPSKTNAPEVGLLAAVAVVDTILELPRHNTAPPRVTCKWPNDVLLESAKVCGILPELVSGPDRVAWIVLGLGINVAPIEVDQPLYPVTALAQHQIDAKPAHVLTVLSRTLALWLERWRNDGFGVIREAWLERGPAIGSDISVNLDARGSEGRTAGHFAGLDHDGALLFETATGRRRVLAGDVLFPGA